MAYDYTKLYMIASNIGGSGHKTFAYETDDTITAESYFPTTAGIEDGDIVEKRDATVSGGETTAMTVTKYVMKADATTGELTAVVMTSSTSTITAANTAATFTYEVTATLGEINAGKEIIPAATGKTIRVVNYAARVSGNFTTTTSVDLQSGTTGTKVTALAVAGLTDGAILQPSSSNTTLGAGFAADLEEGESLVVANTGTDAAGGTSITFTVTAAYIG